MMNRTSSGVDLYSSEISMELMHTDLPEPVVPAISMCGILAMSPMTGLPVIPAISTWGSLAISPTMALPPMSLPTAKATRDRCSAKARESMTSRMRTAVTTRLGTSMPTTELLLGMGAMRTPPLPRARAMSSARFVSLDSFTPWSRVNSYRVTLGPWTTSPGLASTPKLVFIKFFIR